MIRSQREFNVTTKRLQEIVQAIEAFDISAAPNNVQPGAHKAALAALESLRDELQADLEQFQRLLDEGMSAIQVSSLAEIPAALVQARIAQRMTQAQLAAELGIKPQQVQRWEANEYDGAAFTTILDAANVLGLQGCMRLPQQPHSKSSEWSGMGIIQKTDRITIATKVVDGGVLREIAWRDGGAMARIAFGEDSISTNGMPGRKDGRFMRFEWKQDEGAGARRSNG